MSREIIAEIKNYFLGINDFAKHATVSNDGFLHDQDTGETYFRVGQANWYHCPPDRSQEGNVVNQEFSQTLDKVREISLRNKK